jgi:hypothetical protein
MVWRVPDYLLVELGFNDLGSFVSEADGAIANMKTFIANARSAKPDIRFAITNVSQSYLYSRAERFN